MALPTAQLGQMANINVPGYIPSQVVPHVRSPWETALLSILTQAGVGAAQQGVQNVMSRDYAPEFGEQAATGVNKLVSGPRVTERSAEARNTRAAAKESQAIALNAQKEGQLRGIGADAQLAKFNAVQQMLREATQLEAGTVKEGMVGDRFDAEMAQRGQEMGMRERLAGQEIKGAGLRQQIDAQRDVLKQDRELAAHKALIESQVGRNTAEVGKTQAETDQIKFMRKLMEGNALTDSMKTSKNVEAFAAPANPRQQAVQERLKDTSKYPTGEQIMANQQRAVASALAPTVSAPADGTIPQSNGIPPEIAAIAELMRKASYRTLPQDQVNALGTYLQDKPTGGAVDPNDPNVQLFRLLQQYQSQH